MALPHSKAQGRRAGIWVAGQETVSGLVAGWRIVGEPLDGTACGVAVAERVPGRRQVRILLVEFVFEPAGG
jgi:hypothetical protein